MNIRSKKIEKDFMVGNLRCLVIGLSGGWRCGYVGIPKEHPMYAIDYDKIEADVHGGLTYGSTSPVGDKDQRYYVGFDCCHCGDGFDIALIDELAQDSKMLEVNKINAQLCADYTDKVWTTEEVEDEVRRLANWIREKE